MFAAAATQLAFLHYERAVTRTPVTLAGFFAGIAYMRRNRILLGIITLDLFAVLLGGATALLPIFAKDVFDAGPTGLGILRAAPAVGALLITVVADALVVHAQRRPHRVHRGRGVRRRDHRVRVDRLVLAGLVRARRHGRRRCDQRRHPA